MPAWVLTMWTWQQQPRCGAAAAAAAEQGQARGSSEQGCAVPSLVMAATAVALNRHTHNFLRLLTRTSAVVYAPVCAAVRLPGGQRPHRQHSGSSRARHCHHVRPGAQRGAGRRLHEGWQVGAQQVCGCQPGGQDTRHHGLWKGGWAAASHTRGPVQTALDWTAAGGRLSCTCQANTAAYLLKRIHHMTHMHDPLCHPVCCRAGRR